MVTHPPCHGHHSIFTGQVSHSRRYKRWLIWSGQVDGCGWVHWPFTSLLCSFWSLPLYQHFAPLRTQFSPLFSFKELNESATFLLFLLNASYLSFRVVFISSFLTFDSCLYSYSFVISSPRCPPPLPGPGVLSPVPHPPSLQRLWQACRSSAPPCAVTVWAPEIVTPAPPPLSDTTSSPIAKVRAPLHSLLPPPHKATHHLHHHLGCRLPSVSHLSLWSIASLRMFIPVC